jgi:hypothetical protein
MKVFAILFALTLCGCTPQQRASFIPMTSPGTSLTNQAANLYMEQERIKQQQQIRNQQPYGYVP